MRTLILEDNRDRRVAMIGRLAERFPFLRVAFFDSSEKMIEFMESDRQQDLVLISLDHDLEMIPGSQGDWIDPGTGLDVARWLSKRPKPVCPVIVHTTNARAGSKMMRLFEKSHWMSHRVVPHDDLAWIDTDWFQAARNAIVDFAPQRRPMHAPRAESKVGVLRALLNGQCDGGQAFCRAAMTRIKDAYIHDLRSLLGNVSAEVMAFVRKDVLASALDSEGPLIKWHREVGFIGSPAHVFFEMAERGPLTIEQLPCIGENETQRLSLLGINQIQVCLIEVADMQALLVVSAAKTLASAHAQATIAELKQALEIAVFMGLHWPRSDKKSNRTQEEERS